MAKIKYGEFVVTASGKVGGTIHSRNKGGAYVKNWVKPTNPASSFQTAVRAVFSSFSQAWRTLTDAQRAAWNSGTSNYQVIDKLGALITLSGIALYKSLNQNLSTIGESAISTPPMPSGVLTTTLSSMTADVSDDEIHVINSAVVPAGMKIVIECTPAQSPGINNANNKFRVVKVVDAAGAADQEISTEYVARFGSFPPAGSKILSRVKFINKTTGESSTYQSTSCIVQA